MCDESQTDIEKQSCSQATAWRERKFNFLSPENMGKKPEQGLGYKSSFSGLKQNLGKIFSYNFRCIETYAQKVTLLV